MHVHVCGLCVWVVCVCTVCMCMYVLNVKSWLIKNLHANTVMLYIKTACDKKGRKKKEDAPP